MNKKEFIEFVEKVNEENKGVWAYAKFKDEDTLDVELQSDKIKNESSTYHLHRTSLEAAKRDVENFLKWHKVAVQEEENGLEFRDSLYESLNTLEYEHVLMNGETKYGSEWLSEIDNSENGDEVFGKLVEVYRRFDDGYTRVFEIKSKEATLENRSSYKDVCVALGGSDIATLIMVGMTMENRPATVSHLEMKELAFGEDGEYSAWLVDGDTTVPEHYTLTAEFKNWLKIYDDEGYCTYFTAPFIRVYQAGQFGCLIQLCQEYSSIKQLKEMLKSDKRIIAEVMEEEVKRILNSDKTTYQIAKEAGVSTAIIDNYRTGKSKIENMTMNILQKLICGKQETTTYIVVSYKENDWKNGCYYKKFDNKKDAEDFLNKEQGDFRIRELYDFSKADRKEAFYKEWCKKEVSEIDETDDWDDE